MESESEVVGPIKLAVYSKLYGPKTKIDWLYNKIKNLIDEGYDGCYFNFDPSYMKYVMGGSEDNKYSFCHLAAYYDSNMISHSQCFTVIDEEFIKIIDFIRDNELILVARVGGTIPFTHFTFEIKWKKDALRNKRICLFVK
jgi:hypothetical protein